MFASIAVVTLAVGIGPNRAIFSVYQWHSFEAAAYQHPDELIDLK